MKGILDSISYICPITGNSLIDTILFAIIAAISFVIAWKLTGAVSNSTGSHDSRGMSSLHWLLRFVVTIVLLGVVIAVINFIHWIISWPWWGYLILGLGVVGLVGAIIFVNYFIKKKKHKNMFSEKESAIVNKYEQ